MTRNIDRRVEVGCPIYDKRIRRDLREFLNIQFHDNTRTRIIEASQENRYRIDPDKPPVRAQYDVYRIMAEHAGIYQVKGTMGGE